MAITPQFAFRASRETVAGIAELQALLAARRGGKRVSKAKAIGYAVGRALADLQAGGDLVDRMSLDELGAAYRAKLTALNEATKADLDAKGLDWRLRSLTSPATGGQETRVEATGLPKPRTVAAWVVESDEVPQGQTVTVTRLPDEVCPPPPDRKP
jgi:hypothetical protein